VVTDQEMAHIRSVADLGNRSSAPVITDAKMGTSEEMSSRIRRYTITMAFRAACFISMIFVHGMFRWVLFACAVLLPFIAVIAANQVDQHFRAGKKRTPHTMLSGGPELTTGHDDEGQTGEVIEEEHDEQQRPNGRVA
jgi:hypothetical protein